MSNRIGVVGAGIAGLATAFARFVAFRRPRVAPLVRESVFVLPTVGAPR
ncbi:hypothetical protein [[Mycobacterium] nativiensis]|uniref:Uncharacterized protein n=1 Tax=[Mycobacterium] nativiensis TaxID=2855503 RepID=A0ABU5XT75_9MYCO|nr:hypothetical protein [Mycolicibacter sp. MYC340]MEB3031138.1 hypothetical protein [Mycolicibacter sp. MYC340]